MEDAKEFLSALFEHATRNCVVSYANDRNAKIKPVQRYGLTGAQIVEFIKQYDVPGRAVYACTADIPHGVRNKINAGGTLAAFADLDFKDVAHPRAAILEAIALLPLRPSFVNDTGNGFHVWWMFDEPVIDKERVERLLRDIASVMAGDPHVCEVSRVMRIPSTHNSKDGANHLVRIVERNDKRYSIDELEEYFAHVMPLLLRRAKSASVTPTEKRSALERLSEINQAYGVKAGRINTDEWWANLRYPGNVNETIVKVTSSMLSTGVPVDEVVATVLDEVWERVGEIEGWSYKEEHAKIKEECLRWMVKKQDVMEGQQAHGLPDWAAKDGRVRAAIKMAKAEAHAPGNGALNGSGKANGTIPHAPENNAPAGPAADRPVDLWDTFAPVPLPRGLLPPLIETYAFEKAKQMGSDPAGLAMSALAVCAGVIPDCIKLKPLEHSPWSESARLWVLLVGEVSSMKTPMMDDATYELRKIDSEYIKANKAAMAEWTESATKIADRGEKPQQTRVKLDDITIEKAVDIAADNPDGLTMYQDEIQTLFGSIGKYSGNKSGNNDRGHWLRSYNGQEVTVDRMTRGTSHCEHFGLSILGGIQPNKVREIADEGTDDGMLQRMNPIYLQDANTVVRDEPLSPRVADYNRLVRSLHGMPRQAFGELTFTPEARALFLETINGPFKEYTSCFQTFNSQLTAHINKYRGMLLRLCLTFHCIENVGRQLGDIDVDTTRRAVRFLLEYLMPHALSFYLHVLGFADNNDRLLAVAGYILAHKPPTLTNRMIRSGTQTFRYLDKHHFSQVFSQLEALGWVSRSAPKRAGEEPVWPVNPMVYELYKARGEAEMRRRETLKITMAKAFTKRRQEHEENESSHH